MTLPPWIWGVLNLWALCRAHPGAPGGRCMPSAGGLGQQPAALVDAFLLLDHFASGK